MQMDMGEIKPGQGPRKHKDPKSKRVKTTGPTSNQVIRNKKKGNYLIHFHINLN